MTTSPEGFRHERVMTFSLERERCQEGWQTSPLMRAGVLKHSMVILAVWTVVATGGATSSVAQTSQAAGRSDSAAVPLVHDIGGFTITDTSGSGAVKLSGIAYAGGSTYYAVGGGSANLYRLDIDVDPKTGAIRSAAIGASAMQLNDESGTALARADLEGVALAGRSVYVVNEDGPEISRHDLATGRRTGHATTSSHPQLRVFSHAVRNRGWESIAVTGKGSVVCTANEEALKVDGPLATTSAGTVVRLQIFDADLHPMGQWVYVTDPIKGQSGSRYDRAGIVGMLALDDERLIVLERSTGNGFRIQLNLVDVAGATDVSVAPFDKGLRKEAFRPVSKTKLYVKEFTSRNQVNSCFVGVTLGPVLDDGSRSVILIADNGGALNYLVPNNEHTLYALRIMP